MQTTILFFFSKRNKYINIQAYYPSYLTFTYPCVYVPMCACVRNCVHAYLHASMHACIHVCVHAYVYECMPVYVHVCVHACMHACVCMYACVHVCVRACAFVRSCMCVFGHDCVYQTSLAPGQEVGKSQKNPCGHTRPPANTFFCNNDP